jgi:hypothetical protein
MSISPTITGEIDVNEPISSVCNCMGSLTNITTELGYARLPDLTSYDACEALKMVINELDKGNDGLLNDEYSYEVDQKWSSGRETMEEYSEYESLMRSRPAIFPFHDYKSFCGHYFRTRMRKDCVRFWLYYKAELKVRWE